MIITVYTPTGVKELKNFDVADKVEEISYEEMTEELQDQSS